MAFYTKTLTNRISFFGPAGTTRWGAAQPMTWGSSKWGEGSIDLAVLVNPKLISNSLSPTSVISKQLKHTIVNTFSGTFEADFETLGDGTWFYVFRRPTTDAENQVLSTWTSPVAVTPSWTSATVTSTTWSLS